MIVTVPVVGVVKMPIDEVVDMIAVRDRVVPASRTVDVAVRVPVAAMARCAGIRVSSVDRNRVLVDMAVVHRMEMPIVQVVDMAVVLDGAVSTFRAVDVTVVGVNLVVVHSGCPLLHHG